MLRHSFAWIEEDRGRGAAESAGSGMSKSRCMRQTSTPFDTPLAHSDDIYDLLLAFGNNRLDISVWYSHSRPEPGAKRSVAQKKVAF